MNQGFFGFPSQDPNEGVNIQEFETSGFWRKPKGAKMVWVFLVGGGGGGGGARGINSTASAASGGGGGGGGGGGWVFYPASFLPDTVEIVIGAGGSGGTGGTNAYKGMKANLLSSHVFVPLTHSSYPGSR